MDAPIAPATTPKAQEASPAGASPAHGAYSVWKAARHLDRVADLRAGRPVVPVEIQLILSDLCNHDCHFCAYRASDGLSSEQFADETGNRNPKRMIPTKKAQEIVEDAAAFGVRSIIFTGGGEPTVHPDHAAIFKQALTRGIDCALNTNGDVLREETLALLPEFKYVRFSIDAGNADEYAEIRKVPVTRYGKVLANLARLAAEIDKVKSDCVLGAGYVVTPENWVNLREGVTRLRDTGASYVRLASMQSTAGLSAYPGGTWYRALEAAQAVEDLSTESFKVVNLMTAAMGRKMVSKACGMQHFVLYIGANLKAYRCCYTAYTALGECGDLTEQKLGDYLLSLGRAKSLAHFDARTCSTCPLADKNAIIEYVAGPEPLHANFV